LLPGLSLSVRSTTCRPLSYGRKFLDTPVPPELARPENRQLVTIDRSLPPPGWRTYVFYSCFSLIVGLVCGFSEGYGAPSPSRQGGSPLSPTPFFALDFYFTYGLTPSLEWVPSNSWIPCTSVSVICLFQEVFRWRLVLLSFEILFFASTFPSLPADEVGSVLSFSVRSMIFALSIYSSGASPYTA